MTLLNRSDTILTSGSQRAYCSAMVSPMSFDNEYADSGFRSCSSVMGRDDGGCGSKGMPISVSEEARTMFLILSLRHASRTL